MKLHSSSTVSLLLILLVFLAIAGQVPRAAAQLDPLADADGPYSVGEGEIKELNGEKSLNVKIWSWSIISDPTGEAYLTEASTATPIFHAPPELDGDENVSVRLIVADDNGKYDEDTNWVMVLDLLIARPGGPYEVIENQTIMLDGSKSSGYIQSYNWSIISDPTGEAYLTEASTATPILHAPENVSKNEAVEIRLTVTGRDNKSQSKTTVVTVVDPLVCDLGGPYESYENVNSDLDGTGSSGYDDDEITNWCWSIISDPTGEAYMTEASTATPILHAPSEVDSDKAINIRLIVIDKTGRYSESTTIVTIKDRLIARPGGPYEVIENQTIMLDGSKSSGYIQSYNWSIISDPTGEAYLTEASTATSILHAPSIFENIGVMLTVANEFNTSSKTVKITVKSAYQPPNPPLGLLIEGKQNPENLTNPKPSFSLIYDTATERSAVKAQIQVGTDKNERDMWNYTVTGLSLLPGGRLDITYDESYFRKE